MIPGSHFWSSNRLLYLQILTVFYVFWPKIIYPVLLRFRSVLFDIQTANHLWHLDILSKNTFQNDPRWRLFELKSPSTHPDSIRVLCFLTQNHLSNATSVQKCGICNQDLQLPPASGRPRNISKPNMGSMMGPGNHFRSSIRPLYP